MHSSTTTTVLPFGLSITVHANGGGTIFSTLRQELVAADDSAATRAQMLAVCDALESLLLGLACAGVPLNTSAACAGISTAIEAIARNVVDVQVDDHF